MRTRSIISARCTNRFSTYLMHKGVAAPPPRERSRASAAIRYCTLPKMEALAEHLPIRVEFIDSAEKVEEVLPTLYDMVTDGLIEVQDTHVVKVRDEGKAATEPKPARIPARPAKAKLMRIFLGEADRWHEEPLYDAIVKQLRMMEIAGATVYRGIDGYGAKGHSHKKSFFHVSRDLPVMISVIESEEKLGLAAAAVEEMLEDGLIVISDVDIVRLVHANLPTS